jgi:uncharacterized repeat protein (TIGR03803 family)
MIYRAGALAAMVVVLSAGSCSAAKFKAIYSFCVEQDCADGAGTPNDLFYDAAKDTLYGTTWGGGEFGKGTFYSLKRNKKGKWKHSVLFAFPCDTQCPGGYSPGAGLIRDKDGNFYSTSRLGAFGAPGGVFKLVRAGKSWTEVGLYDFCQQPSCADGGSPEGLTYAGEAQGQPYDEVSPLYGVTAMGGGHGDGEVYSLTPNGDGWTFSVIYSFLDAGVPFGALTMDANENLFGRTTGRNSKGAIFELSKKSGEWSVSYWHDLNGASDGEIANRGFFLDSSGIVFGATRLGGDTEFESEGGGTIFELSGSTYQVVHDFCTTQDCRDGMEPAGGLTPDANGNLLGVVDEGGDYAHGGVYRWNGSQSTLLYSFCKKSGCPDGNEPINEVTLDLSGNIYGVVAHNGINSEAGIFELTP